MSEASQRFEPPRPEGTPTPGWAFAEDPDRLATLHTLAGDASTRQALAHLGREHHIRHREAWSQARFRPDPRDAEVATLWREVLSGQLTAQNVRAARKLAGPPVRAAMRALARGLGLPSEVLETILSDAEDALVAFPLGAHLDVASRIVETQGPPLNVLAAALPTPRWTQLAACVAGRPAWQAGVDGVGALIPGDPQQLAKAADWAIALRATEVIQSQESAPSDDEPLGWSVARAHHDRMRGRLRALLALDPAALSVAITALPALTARTDAALRRWAWAWAWREARVGFAFSVERTTSAACAPRPQPPTSPPWEPDEDAVRTLLLCLAGRGVWDDLLRWVRGCPGRDLSTSFYRYLSLSPPSLSDTHEGRRRSRSYEGLRTHLDRGGLARHHPALVAAARAVQAIEPGRDQRARLAGALAPWWSQEAMPLPAHRLGSFADELVRCAARQEHLGA